MIVRTRLFALFMLMSLLMVGCGRGDEAGAASCSMTALPAR